MPTLETEALTRRFGDVTAVDRVTMAVEAFVALSFPTLPVVPALRITDLGLVDVARNRRARPQRRATRRHRTCAQ